MSKIYRFSDSLERELSNDVFQSQHFDGALICHFSGPWAIIHGIAKLANTQI